MTNKRLLGALPTYRGEYQEDTEYYFNNIVRKGDATHVCITDRTTTQPPSSDWDIFCESKSTYEYAVEHGYQGSEEEYYKALGEVGELLNALTSSTTAVQATTEVIEHNTTAIGANTQALEDNVSALNTNTEVLQRVGDTVNLLTEFAVGKKKIAEALTQQGVATNQDATFDSMADNVRNLFLPTDTDFWKAFGYDSAEDLEGGLSDLVRNTQYMQEQWEKVLTGDLAVSNWTSLYPNGKSAMVVCPKIDCSQITTANNLFHTCTSLTILPQLNFENCTNLYLACFSTNIVEVNFINTSRVTNMKDTFNNCPILSTINRLDVSGVTNFTTAFNNCPKLQKCYLDGLKIDVSLSFSPLLTPESVAFIVSHSAATSAITITLHATAYANAIADAEVQAALEAHPLVTLASA